MIIEPKESFIFQQSFIQFRISSMNSSGLTNVIRQESSITYIINQCKLTGSNIVQSSNNGYIASTILGYIQLNITQFDVCVDSTSRFGQNSVYISIIGGETVQCDICKQFVVYGICSEVLQYSEYVKGIYICVYPFVFNDNQCVCATGYLLNNTKCINIVESLNIISNQISNSSNAQINYQQLAQQIYVIENDLFFVKQSMANNILEIETLILSNFSKSDYNLFMNTSILDKRIHQNITILKSEIQAAYIKVDANLLANTTVLDQRIFNNVSQLNTSLQNITIQINTLEQQVATIENQQDIIAYSILSNFIEIENKILSNFSESDQNLMLNTQILDNRIYQNISSIKKDILRNQITVDNNLLTNSTVLDQRIFENVSLLQNTMNNFNDSLLKQQQIIEQQQNIINSLKQQINCISNSGYSMINGSCVQVSCLISGQQSINGICQCINTNSIVKDGSCVCPVDSYVIGTACVCRISGQIMLNGQCVCQTIGALVENNICKCGVNSINISNMCSCPSGASLVNGICTCSNINAYISGNECICPSYSSLVGNICTCPSNSQIVNNICTCNLITGQIMNNGVCDCQTPGAFVNNSMCTCGVNALNISNACTCPTNSSLVNNVCICNIIAGQAIINGQCQCPAGQSVVNESCKLISYTINISDFECKMNLFTRSFDIQSMTSQISSSNNFSAGYVFSVALVIQNAFIDISDNVYQTTVHPLFQSQNTFINLKIQFGTQSLNSGSLLLSSSSVSINHVNIISRPGSQLTVNAVQQLNIITPTSINANLTNLLVNLSIIPSNGNITLISEINDVLNITGYQIIGTYISTGTIAMIGLNINSATVNVNLVSFQPTDFNVGNGSSYLFGNATTTSTIQINNFAVILGSSTNYLLLSSILTTSITSNYYLFGGIIAHINSNSVFTINNVILDSYQKFSTDYVRNSGFLVGQNINSNLSSITIKNLCLQQNMTSTTLEYKYFGLIGGNIGNTSFQDVSIKFSVRGSYFWCFGIIGYQYNYSIYAEIVYLRTQVSVSSENGTFVGSIFGAQYALNCQIQNANVTGGNISSGLTNQVGCFIGQQNYNMTIMNSLISQMNISGTNYVGGFVGYEYNATIMNSSIQQTNIFGTSYVGGFVGQCVQLHSINSKIQFTHLSGPSDLGIIVSYGSSIIYFTSSSSTQNYINGVLQNDCVVLSNGQTGC
ncbi:Conserved_hypothetical protein [Hexamita inflata]|uniref:Uncharacterized protein n=1 Tax=Hexamita inflata TaxID=28002 RepID=A0ABP1HUR7_9EUKA